MKPETLRRYFANMPPLDHFPKRESGEPFRWEDSEVIQWFIRHTPIPNRILTDARRAGAVVFDPVSKTWRGYKSMQTITPERLQNPVSSNSSFLPTSPSSKYQYPYAVGGTGYIDDDRQTPDPLSPVVESNDDDGQNSEVRDEPW